MVTLNKELLESKFNKISAVINVRLSKGEFEEAKSELSQLNELNIEPERTTSLTNKLSTAINEAVLSDVERGQAALRLNDVAGAEQALSDARMIDANNPIVSTFATQISDLNNAKRPSDTQTLATNNPTVSTFTPQINKFKYSRELTKALKAVTEDNYPEALGAINTVLAERPDDENAVSVKQTLNDFMPIALAKQFDPNQAVASKVETPPDGNLLVLGRIADSGYYWVDIKGGNGASQYTMHIDVPADEFRDGKPPVGTTALFYVCARKFPTAQNYSTPSPYFPHSYDIRFVFQASKMLPVDFISQHKSQIESLIKSAVVDSAAAQK